MNRYIILALCLAVLVAGGVIFGLLFTSENAGEKVPEGSIPKPILDENMFEDIKDAQPGEIQTSDIKPPDILSRKTVITANLIETEKNRLIQEIEELKDQIKANSNVLEPWVDLGLRYKVAGDYEGARLAWEYAAAIRPKSSTPFSNLGILYGYYLQNNELAERNMLQAIENDPQVGYYYINMADFYLDVLKNKEKAIKILEKGIIAFPNDQDLLAKLKEVYSY